MQEYISITGARQNNLKNVSLKLPREVNQMYQTKDVLNSSFQMLGRLRQNSALRGISLAPVSLKAQSGGNRSGSDFRGGQLCGKTRPAFIETLLLQEQSKGEDRGNENAN